MKTPNPKKQSDRKGTIAVRGDLLESTRIGKGLSYEELSERTEWVDPKGRRRTISITTIKKAERGGPCYLGTIRRLAETIGLEPHALGVQNGEAMTLPAILPLSPPPESQQQKATPPRSAPPPTELPMIAVIILGDDNINEFSKRYPNTQDFIEFLRRSSKSKWEIVVDSIEEGSVIIKIKINEDDFLAMLRAFYELKLKDLGVTEIVLPLSSLDAATGTVDETNEFLDKVNDIFSKYNPEVNLVANHYRPAVRYVPGMPTKPQNAGRVCSSSPSAAKPHSKRQIEMSDFDENED
jgi:hypothetical protein